MAGCSATSPASCASLQQRAAAKAAGLYAFRLLDEGDEPAP